MSTPIIKEIPFAQWTRQMLFKYFGIRKKYDCPLPFFFIHKYKPEEPKGNTDGRGQLLAMMLAAKALNEHPTPKFEPFSWIKVEKNLPVYGSYVIGVNWYFMVLHNDEYCMGEPYNVREEEELFQLFRILKMQRTRIVEKIKEWKSKKKD